MDVYVFCNNHYNSMTVEGLRLPSDLNPHDRPSYHNFRTQISSFFKFSICALQTSFNNITL